MVGGSNVVVQAALSQLGKPYVWDTPLSATNPNPKSFDCSGLTMWCYRKAGISLGHQTNVQYRQLKHRKLSEAQPGDLVFFGTLADLYHVGLYIGDSTIVEAPDVGIPVRRRKISSSSPGIWKTVGAFPGSQTTSGGAKPVTYREYFTAVLARLGAPVTDANLRALARVSIIEGTNDRWNPLNSVVPVEGSQPFNSVGVQDYGNYSSGVAGTVKLLSGNAWHSVVSALRLGNSEGGVVNAFAQTYAGWGSHPSFGSVSDSRATALLNTSMGNAVPNLDPVPPYSLTELHKPLTGAQRAAILAWLRKVKQPYGASEKSSDDKLLESYKTALVMFHYDPKDITKGNTALSQNDWLTQLLKILSWFTSVDHWKRIGLFALGVVILILTFTAFVKGNV